MENVFATSGSTTLLCDSVIFYSNTGRLRLFDNIVIIKENFLFSGNNGDYFINEDSGFVMKKFFLKTDSSLIKGNYATFNKERIKIFESPSYERENLLISSDTIIYKFNDSTAIFLQNVRIKTKEIKGLCGKLFYNDRMNDGYFYDNPVILTEKDSIVCDSGYFDFKKNESLSFRTFIFSRLDDGSNKVSGNLARFFFSSNKLDSLFIFNDTKGEFAKYDSLNKKP
jgi:hypothetical protein